MVNISLKIPMIETRRLRFEINWEDLSPLCQQRAIAQLYNYLMDNEATRPSLRKEYQDNVLMHLRHALQDTEKHIAVIDLFSFLEW